MSWNPLMFETVNKLDRMGYLKNRRAVVEIGNQTVKLGPHLRKMNKRYDAKVRNGQSSEKAYRAMGYESYTSFDVNKRHGSILCDFNRDEDIKSAEKVFYTDLVTNNGTGEHVFHQPNIFQLMHRCCRIGGVILHILPFVNWLNHGFFSYHPLLFCDVAKENSYEMIMLRIGHRWGFSVDIAGFGKPELTAAVAAVKKDLLRTEKTKVPNVSVIAAMRKTEGSPEFFRPPIQGRYAKDISSSAHKKKYK